MREFFCSLEYLDSRPALIFISPRWLGGSLGICRWRSLASVARLYYGSRGLPYLQQQILKIKTPRPPTGAALVIKGSKALRV